MSFVVACVTGVFIAFAGAAGAEGTPARDGPRVEYTVRLPEPQTQMVEMSVVLHGLTGDAIDLCLPVWRPGRYVVLDPSGTVREARARSGDGQTLEIVKTDKSTWRVSTGGAPEIVVDYRVYANNLGERTRHVDDTHAFLSPASVFMYAPSLRDEPLEVHVDAPQGWRVATGLEHDPADERTLRAPNYDVLVDSPLEIGVQERVEFEVDGVPHEIVVWWGGKPSVESPPARPRYFDLERMRADFARIVRAQRDVFGDLPYTRYVYIFHAAAGVSGGTEHLNSFVIQAAPSRFHTESGYRGFLSTVSHEMFHTWNVKQLRPAALKPYDYQQENYSDLLWVAEGTTTYYQGVVLVRAGLMKPDAYLKSVGDSIDSIRRRPGATVQSVEDASVNSWVMFNRTNADGVNSTVSFYESGQLASLVLDMEIRRASGGEASLDDLMRDLYRRFPLAGPGYTRADVIDAAVELGFEGAPAFFDRCVRGVEPLDFEHAMEWVGLSVSRGKGVGGRPRADAAEDSGGADEAAPYLGLNVETRDGAVVVSSVLADGPAYVAGLMAGDVLVALNGERVRAGAWNDMAGRLRPGEPAKITLFRMEVLREHTVEPQARPSAPWRVSRVDSPTELQRAEYQRWLGQPWPREKGEAVTGPAGAPAGEARSE